MFLLLDKNLKYKKALQPETAVETEELDGIHSLELFVEDEVKKGETILMNTGNRVGEFSVVGVDQKHEGSYVYAENIIESMRYIFVTERRPTGNADDHLRGFRNHLSRYGWSIEVSPEVASDPTSIQRFYYRTDLRSILKRIEETFDVEIYAKTIITDPDTPQIANAIQRVLCVEKRRGSFKGKRFTYDKDILSITRKYEEDDVITALYGFGKGEELETGGYGRRISFSDLNKPDSPKGSMCIFDEDAREKYGFPVRMYMPNGIDNIRLEHRYGKVEFQDIDDVEELYEETRKMLKQINKPKISYEADVVLLDGDHEEVEVGDEVYVIDDDFPFGKIEEKMRVVKMEIDHIDKMNTRVEIGNRTKNISDLLLEDEEIMDEIKSKIGIWDKTAKEV